MKVGVNLFGAARWISNDLERDLERLREIGVTSIEPAILFSSSLPGAKEGRLMII